jgi:hypothetical protein
MFNRKPLLGIAAACVILMSSCKKDLVSSEQTVDSAVVSSDATAANDVYETAAPLTKALTTYVSSDCAGYYEVLPARYSLTTKQYPLMIFIHGIGELGTGVSRLTCCGLPYYANKKLFPPEFIVNGQHFSYIVVAPQFKVRPSAWQVQEIINYATKKYRVDPTRIYVSGLSMGGGSTWDYTAVYGKNIAAAVPVAGGTAATTTLARNVASTGVPVWTISSTADALVPISWARNWISWIKTDNPSNAGNVKLTEYTSGESHNTTWTKATNPATIMDGYNIYQWMLKFRRVNGNIVTTAAGATPTAPVTSTGNKAPVANAGADATIHLSWKFSPLLNSTLSKDADGWINSVAWSKVSGPSTYTIASPKSLQSRVSFTGVGTYIFRVTITDNKGATSTDNVIITVLA